MSSAAESRIATFTQVEQLRNGRAILRQEADAVAELSRQLGLEFCHAVERLFHCTGAVIVSGMGKAGLIGQKISATLSSTGTRSWFLHPGEAVHGDLGCLTPGDLLLLLSNSGETEEICRLLPIVRRMQVPLIAITAESTSTLGAAADVPLCIGRLREAGPHGLAPSTTTTVMLALGDALALVVSRMKNFSPQQFALIHPAGSLGARLKTAGEIMRTGDDLRVAAQTATVREVFAELSKPGRRTGAIMLVDKEGRLTGLFTDSDLARLLEERCYDRLDQPIEAVMTTGPTTIGADMLVEEIVTLLSERKISELPVVDENRRPIGLIDITDVIGLLPQEFAA